MNPPLFTRPHRRIPQCFVLVLLLGSAMALAQKQGARMPHQVNLRRIQSEHISLFFTSDYADYTQPLLEEGERFLATLAGRWSVILPKDRIAVSLGGPVQGKALLCHLEHPSWLMSAYDRTHGRVEVRILDRSKVRFEEMVPLFRHNLVHALLNLPRIKRPPQFLQEGLARYYAGDSSGHTRLLAVMGFRAHKEIAPLVEHDVWSKQEAGYLEVSALAGLFVEYMWQANPEGEVQFVQALQKGIAWKEALRQSGYEEWTPLIQEFNVKVRADYGLHTLLYTYDLWLLLIGTAVLVWMVVRVRQALVVARLPVVELAPLPEPVTASELTGPAFGDLAAAKPVARGYAAVPETTSRRIEELRLPTGSRVKAVLDQPEGVDGIVPPPRPGASVSIELQDGQTLPNLSLHEEDVDDAFDRMLSAAPEGEAKTTGREDDAFEDVEHDLDDVFDHLIGKDPKRR